MEQLNQELVKQRLRIPGKFQVRIIGYEHGQTDRLSLLQQQAVIDMSPAELARHLGKIDHRLIVDPGACKGLNTSVNDVFQLFTRKYLSKRCTIVDVDALLPGHCILELKRIRSCVKKWLPYLDDLPNYTVLNSLAQCMGVYLITIAYSKDDRYRDLIALHREIQGNNDEATSKQRISGYKLLLTTSDALNLLVNDQVLSREGWQKYSSQNRRQQR